MATVTSPAQQKVILRGVSWGTYQRLLAEHEQPKRTLEILVDVLAEEFGVDVQPVGSLTFQREDLQKGFEPDSAFYISRASEVEGRFVDPAVDPPPDLIIEVDVSSPSLNRFPIFAAFGAPEVWRYDGSRVAIYRLEAGRYVEAVSSSALPPLTAETATRFLQERESARSTQWVRHVREWPGASSNTEPSRRRPHAPEQALESASLGRPSNCGRTSR